MIISSILFYISILLSFWGMRKFKFNFDLKDNINAMKTSIPFISTFAIITGIRHTYFHGNLKVYGGRWEKEGPLFEIQSGISNLIFGIVLLLSINKRFTFKSQAALLLFYGLYLFASIITHLVEMIHSHTYNFRNYTLIFIFFISYVLIHMSIVILLNQSKNINKLFIQYDI
jgi:uncharacterized protein YhhL (DUF1145 family)